MRLQTAILALLLLGGVLFAQGGPSATLPSFQEIMSQFSVLQEEHEENQQMVTEFGSTLQTLATLPNADAVLEASLRLGRHARKAIQTLLQEQDSQIAFKGSLTRYSGEHQLLKQEQTYIAHYLEELQKFGKEQENALRFLQNAMMQLDRNVAYMQPPQSFSCGPGIEFVLVAPPKKVGFYVTSTPLTGEQALALWRAANPALTEEKIRERKESFDNQGIILEEAQQMAGTLGRMLGGAALCKLPAESQLDDLKEYGRGLDKAVWLDGKLLFPPQEKEALQRFGMTMGRIWDPCGCLGPIRLPKGAMSELPWTRTPELGCIFLTSLEVGKAQKRAAIERRLDEEERAFQEAQKQAQEQAAQPQAVAQEQAVAQPQAVTQPQPQEQQQDKQEGEQ